MVGAGKESILNLAAAASEQDALYVTVSSADTPVAAVVRTIAMDGLTSKGSDYAVPNNASAKALAINGLSEATPSICMCIRPGSPTSRYLGRTEKE